MKKFVWLKIICGLALVLPFVAHIPKVAMVYEFDE